MMSPKDGNLSYLCLGATSLLVPETFKFKNFETWLPATNNNGPVVNINLSNSLYWYATLNFCKYLKKNHLRNIQVNKASSINKGIVKICLVVDIVRKIWPWIVAGCGLQYFVLACFGSFWVHFENFRTAKRLKYLFVTAMWIPTMARIIKNKTIFIFS